MKERLLATFVDLPLECFALLIVPDNSPGIEVSTIPELAAALLREDEHSRQIAHSVAITAIRGMALKSENSQAVRTIESVAR